MKFLSDKTKEIDHSNAGLAEKELNLLVNVTHKSPRNIFWYKSTQLKDGKLKVSAIPIELFSNCSGLRNNLH